jgi:hypothetical protein
MKPWLSPIAQLIVGLAMVPQAFLFGALGTVPAVETILVGKHFWQPGGLMWQENLYLVALLVASFAVDAAAILCLVSAILFIRKPSLRGVRLFVAGAICYWIYILAHLAMISTLQGGMTLQDAVDYPIGIVAALVAFALHSHHKVRSTPASQVT